MRLVFLIMILGFVTELAAQTIKVNEPVRMLALGDSYTIGQSVPVSGRWPVQFINRLEEQYGITDGEVDIIAQTGWTTTNLKTAIRYQLDETKSYNLVSLLIGVNNQFQGRSQDEYTTEFTELLQTALSIVSNEPDRVFVLSIPDYAYTPSFEGSTSISREIDQFNALNRSITYSYLVPYVNVTDISRRGLLQPTLVASDGLHPSEKQYGEWVEKVLESVEQVDYGVFTGPDRAAQTSWVLHDHYLELKGDPPGGTFRLIDLSGRAVVTQNLYPGQTMIRIPSLPEGIYVAHLKSDRIVLRKKLLIR